MFGDFWLFLREIGLIISRSLKKDKIKAKLKSLSLILYLKEEKLSAILPTFKTKSSITNQNNMVSSFIKATTHQQVKTSLHQNNFSTIMKMQLMIEKDLTGF